MSKGINRLRKEIHRLFSTYRNIKYLLKSYNVYYWEQLVTFKLQLSKSFKNVTRSVFRELQLARISLNFKISCCNLKIRSLGSKLCVFILIFQKKWWRFKVNLNKNEMESKIENPTHSFRETGLVLQLI